MSRTQCQIWDQEELLLCFFLRVFWFGSCTEVVDLFLNVIGSKGPISYFCIWISNFPALFLRKLYFLFVTFNWMHKIVSRSCLYCPVVTFRGWVGQAQRSVVGSSGLGLVHGTLEPSNQVCSVLLACGVYENKQLWFIVQLFEKHVWGVLLS